MITIDFETRSTVDLRKCGADVYARHSSTDVLCTGFAFDDKPVKVWSNFEGTSAVQCSRANVQELFERIQAGEEVVAHNAPFELGIWEHVCEKRYGWPKLSVDQTVCTMAMSYAMALPGALADAAPAAGLTLQKDTAGHRVMMSLSQPRKVTEGACLFCDGLGGDCTECYGSGDAVDWWTPITAREKFDKLYAYCAQDVEVERQLMKRLMRLSPLEREVWTLDHAINRRGIQIDLDAVKAAISLIDAEKERFDQELRRVTGNAVATVSSVGQLTDWLKLKGLVVEGVAKADVVDLLSNPNLPEDARQALLLRQEAAKSSTAKLEAMLRGVCEDGRLRGLFQYHGAGATGRFAGRRIQPQNFVRGKLTPEQVEEIFSILHRVAA